MVAADALKRIRHAVSRAPVVCALIAVLVGCSGGGGGGGGASGDPAASSSVVPPVVPNAVPNVLRVTVVDSFGSRVPGATVAGAGDTTITDGNGVATVLVDPNLGASDITVTISRQGFASNSVTTNVPGKVKEIEVVLARVTLAAGGSLASRGRTLPTIDAAGQQATFEVELVVVDGESRAIESLAAADFALLPCTPSAATPRLDCMHGLGSGVDAAYAPVDAGPEKLELIPGGAARPYAATLLLDQSGSILNSDPSHARLSSAKAFMKGLGNEDRVLLAAFAGQPGALIPTPPLAVYAPFRDSASAGSYFATLDALASTVGGRTPLYSALDALRQQVVGDATLPAGLSRAIVVFTDGADTSCDNVSACSTRRDASIREANASQVRLFTIGLSTGIDVVALGELANKTGGAMLYADSPEQLLPLYGSVGKLLSLSLPTYRLRWTVQGAPGAFRSGNTLLGRVQVKAPGNTFEVPFVVGLP